MEVCVDPNEKKSTAGGEFSLALVRLLRSVCIGTSGVSFSIAVEPAAGSSDKSVLMPVVRLTSRVFGGTGIVDFDGAGNIASRDDFPAGVSNLGFFAGLCSSSSSCSSSVDDFVGLAIVKTVRLGLGFAELTGGGRASNDVDVVAFPLVVDLLSVLIGCSVSLSSLPYASRPFNMIIVLMRNGYEVLKNTTC